MKKITLLLSAFALVATSVVAQSKPGKTVVPPTRTCGTMDMISQGELDAIEDWLAPQVATYLNQQAMGGSPEVLYTIPTIVHIIHNSSEGVGSGRNIPLARVTEQIQTLNDDFRRTNSDAGNTPAAFLPVAADCEINFCLITTYPSGHPNAGQPLAVPGVDRVDATTIGVGNTTTGYPTGTINGTIKPATSWNPAEVMNIWVLQLQGGLLGYAQFPGGAGNTDGTVMGYQYFGNTASVPFHLGRTTTHEVGHWLNLRHINGDSNCGNDLVADTPTQQSLTNGCPSHPRPSCSSDDMFQNYMDYSNDNCMNIFSAGQKARMQSTMASAPNRATLSGFSATLCAPIPSLSDDAGITATTTPVGTFCAGTIVPVVDLRNFGTNTLTSVTINYLVDGAPQTPFAWTGSLASGATISVNLLSLNASAGPHTFDANTTLPNGTADLGPSNDAATQTNFTVNTAAGQALPYIEGFEGSYLPTGMTANNDDGDITWAKTTAAAKTGVASAFMDYYNYSTSKGLEDDIITPGVDLTTVTGPTLTFEVAYKLYTDPNDPTPFSDTLEVLISVDCGNSWISLYRKESTNLTTTTPTWINAPFIPTGAEWRQEVISLNAYSSSTNAMVMFRGIGDYENHMYIDDINIDFSTGLVDNSADTEVNIFPNPATDLINVLLTSVDNAEIVVFNLVGEVIYNNSEITNRINKIDMSEQANGVYFVKVKSGDKITTKKIMLVD